MNAMPKLRDYDDPTYNPFITDEAMFGENRDPYPLLAELRAKGRVVEGDYRVLAGVYPDLTFPTDARYFMILGTEEIHYTMTHPELFSNHTYMFNLGITFGNTLSTMDAPHHPKYRPIFQKIFMPKYVNAWGAQIVDPVVNELMDAFIHTGEADLIKQFTFHYPFRVIYKQIALPPEEAPIFHKLAMGQIVVSYDIEHGTEASRKLGEYFTALIAVRRANPGDDLVSLLVTAEINGEHLPDDVLISFFRQLVNAAGDTTYRGTSVLLTKLLENPEQLELLRNNRALIPNAIDEALRYDGPVLTVPRWTTQDVELGGVQIPAGSVVTIMNGLANRDPAIFPNPDRFDITRPNSKDHIAFLGGPHVCVGRHLARVEMTRALTAILDRLHNLRLDTSKPAPVIRGAMMRVTDHLYVKFDPA